MTTGIKHKNVEMSGAGSNNSEHQTTSSPEWRTDVG